MKAIILAAGTGSRLGKNIPKSLVKITKTASILDHQLENLSHVTDLENISIIVGYKSDLIISRYPGLNTIKNDNYTSTNTSKSLFLGLSRLGENDDIIFLNGDVVFNPEILNLIMDNRLNNLICVNDDNVGEEEIKYNLDNKGYISQISKTIKYPLGEAVGINYIKRETIPILTDCLEICSDNDYFEKGIELTIEKGEIFLPLNICNRFCIEIDFEEDLERAKTILKTQNNKPGNLIIP